MDRHFYNIDLSKDPDWQEADRHDWLREVASYIWLAAMLFTITAVSAWAFVGWVCQPVALDMDAVDVIVGLWL